ncbi:MAG: hypothetical protein L6Q77_00835 [Bacteroidetes bacterium]|nr:hypothetical protein [Bacteroidota bacterium]
MSTQNLLVFPDLIFLTDYNGNIQEYFNAVYQIFESHFIKSNPHFKGIRVNTQKFPLEDGIHRTFYHITHEGNDEKNRLPDLRRMERIRYPRFIIESFNHPDFLVWKNKRKNETRVLIFNQKENYLVVLGERKGYNLLVTAYLVDHEHTQKKLLAEYKTSIKAETA